MINGIILTILCVFAVYGAVRLVFGVFARLSRGGAPRRFSAHTVLFLHNNQEDAEMWIRSMVWGKTLGGRADTEDIIAVDTGSGDNTFSIIKRLEREYDFVYAMKMDDYISFIKEY